MRCAAAGFNRPTRARARAAARAVNFGIDGVCVLPKLVPQRDKAAVFRGAPEVGGGTEVQAPRAAGVFLCQQAPGSSVRTGTAGIRMNNETHPKLTCPTPCDPYDL